MAKAIEKSERVGAAARSRSAGVARAAVRIREAVPADRARLATLRHQAEEVHARLLPDYFRVSTSAPVPGPASAGVATLVAERDSGPAPAIPGAGSSMGAPTVLGYVTLKLVETPRDPAMTPRRRVHVEIIVVDATHRGLGVGTALMRAATDWARRREAVELVLTVWSENHPAEALYKRLGYKPIARVLRRAIDS